MWPQPVLVAVRSKEAFRPGVDLLRKLTMDVPIYALAKNWSSWIKMAENSSNKVSRQRVLEAFKKAALHVPAKMTFMDSAKDFEKRAFCASFQSMENIETMRERFGPTAMSVCEFFFRGKELLVQELQERLDLGRGGRRRHRPDPVWPQLPL